MSEAREEPADADAARFARLYESLAPALYAWACLRIRPEMRSQVDPEDVVAEVWYRGWKAFGGFGADAAEFRSWVFRIAKNVMLEAFRRMRSAPRSAGAPGSSTRVFQVHNVPDAATAISRRVARHEGLAEVLTWAAGLDEEEQKLFVLCGLEGMGYAEVAERMQLGYDTVAKRWQKLRERVSRFAAPRELLDD